MSSNARSGFDPGLTSAVSSGLLTLKYRPLSLSGPAWMRVRFVRFDLPLFFTGTTPFSVASRHSIKTL